MILEDAFLQGGDGIAGRLKDYEDLGAGFELALPPVVRFQFGNEVGAGNEPLVESGIRQFPGHVQAGRRDQDAAIWFSGLHGIPKAGQAIFMKLLTLCLSGVRRRQEMVQRRRQARVPSRTLRVISLCHISFRVVLLSRDMVPMGG